MYRKTSDNTGPIIVRYSLDTAVLVLIPIQYYSRSLRYVIVRYHTIHSLKLVLVCNQSNKIQQTNCMYSKADRQAVTIIHRIWKLNQITPNLPSQLLIQFSFFVSIVGLHSIHSDLIFIHMPKKITIIFDFFFTRQENEHYLLLKVSTTIDISIIRYRSHTVHPNTGLIDTAVRVVIIT